MSASRTCSCATCQGAPGHRTLLGNVRRPFDARASGYNGQDKKKGGGYPLSVLIHRDTAGFLGLYLC